MFFNLIRIIFGCPWHSWVPGDPLPIKSRYTGNPIAYILTDRCSRCGKTKHMKVEP